MFKKVLIANRGEIAVRIIRACRSIGVEALVVHSASDRNSLAVRLADAAIELEGNTAAETYLDGAAVVSAAESAEADAIHPGYGFLAENAAFADAVIDAGLAWVGPPAEAIRLMGDKVAAREVAQRAGVPGVPGTSDPVSQPEEVLSFADEHRYPIVIKAAAGGGGRGMRIVREAAEVEEALASAGREAASGFGDDRVYVERYLEWPRHVEVQLLSDSYGNHVAVGDRDCSVQRRHQKLIEEAPAPLLSDSIRTGLADAAVSLAAEVGYVGAGTLEFLVAEDEFFFLEMNTRLQVEHPVTEATAGLDLVVEQLRVAAGETLELGDLGPRGHAIECRINAEDPAGGRFLPRPGTITLLDVPFGPGVRFDAGYEAGDEVPSTYDNLIGKLIVWGPDREAARRAMVEELKRLRVEGVPTTAGAQLAILEHDDFMAVTHATPWLESGAVALPESPAEPDVALSTDAAGEDEHLAEEVFVQGRRYELGAALIAVQPAEGRPAAGTRRRGGERAGGRHKRTAAASGPKSGAITAPLQGTVTRVLVAQGAAIEEGETILMIEAMKMENEVVATRSGTVAELTATEGQSVAAGDTLAVIQPAEG